MPRMLDEAALLRHGADPPVRPLARLPPGARRFVHARGLFLRRAARVRPAAAGRQRRAAGTGEIAPPPPLQPVTRTSRDRAGRGRALAIREAGGRRAAQVRRQERKPARRSARQGRHRLDRSRAAPWRSPAQPTGLNISTHAQRLAPRHRPDRRPGRQPHRRARRPARQQLGSRVQKLTTRALDQRADIRGNVTVNARPALLPTWRIEPNLSGKSRSPTAASLSPGSSSTSPTKSSRCSTRRSTSRSAAWQRGCATTHRSKTRRASNGRQMCRSIPLGGGAPALPEPVA